MASSCECPASAETALSAACKFVSLCPRAELLSCCFTVLLSNYNHVPRSSSGSSGVGAAKVQAAVAVMT